MGGGEYGLYYLLQHLDRKLFEPVLACNARGPLTERAEAIGVQTEILPFDVVMIKHLIRPGVFLRNFRASVAVKDFVRKQKFDIIQCSDVLSLILLLPALLSRRIPVLYSVTFLYEWSRALLFDVLAVVFVERVAVLSRLVQNDLAKKTIGLRRKIRLIYWGVDTARFCPRSNEEKKRLRVRLGLPTDKKLVGFIGRYELWKGHRTFLAAAGILARSFPGIVFLIVGGATTEDIIPAVAKYRKSVEAKMKDIGLDRELIVWGHHDDVHEIMASLDVYVCPSDHEPFGLVVLEALASNVPVVASSTVGALEVIGDRSDVFVAEPGSPESFAQKISEALAYTGNPGSQHGDHPSFSSWKECARRYEEIYEEITR